MGQRAVSPVMGMVILAGLTAIVGLSVVVVGITVVDGAQSSAETTQAENSMVEFANTANDVAQGSTQSDSYELSGANDATTWVNESAGQVELSLYDNGTETWNENGTFGVLKQEISDDTEIAYQGGGVWKHEQGGVSMVSPPDLEYRDEPVPTLTFPVVQLEGDAVNSGSLQGSLNVDTRDSVSNGINPLDGDHLTIDVRSRYCEGWENHLEDQTNTTFDERCSGDGRVVANMSVGETNRTVDRDTPSPEEGDIDGAIVGNEVRPTDWSGVNVSGDIVFSDAVEAPQNQSGTVDSATELRDTERDRVLENGSSVQEANDTRMFPMDYWEQKLENRTDEATNATPFDSDDTYGGDEVHYIDINDTIDHDTVKIDASSNDQTLVFDGDLNLSSQKALINITGTNNVTIYVDGSIDMNGNPSEKTGYPDSPANLTIVAMDDVYITGETPLYGVVISPSGTVEIDGSSTIEGALIADKPVVETGTVKYAADGWQSGDVDDDSESAISYDIEQDLSYLHVTETRLEVAG